MSGFSQGVIIPAQMGTVAAGGAGYVSFSITGVNFNSANTDNAITITLPAGYTRFRANLCLISHASGTLTTATCGLFTAAAAGGVAIVASGSAITVSTASENTANNVQSLSIATATSSFSGVATVYFRVQTAQGSAATGDVTFVLTPLP